MLNDMNAAMFRTNGSKRKLFRFETTRASFKKILIGRDNARERAAMRHFTVRQFKDIGLSREEAACEIAKPF